MSPVIATILVVAAILIVGGILLFQQRKHTAELKQQFGKEYDRAINVSDNTVSAERALDQRRQRVSEYDIRPLTAAQKERFTKAWDDVQRLFVDSPAAATKDAERLITNVMTTRGYPMADFNQQADDLSVNYPSVVQNYRHGNNLVRRYSEGDGDTETMRQAMIHFRSLFDELVSAVTDRDGPLGDRDGDGTPNMMDTRDARGPRHDPIGDRDRDGIDGRYERAGDIPPPRR